MISYGNGLLVVDEDGARVCSRSEARDFWLD